MKRPSRFFLALAIFWFPLTASANAGTPLMWASMLHLIFGNMVLGVIEGLLLAWAFKLSKWKSIAILIVSNYASAWCGRLIATDDLLGLQDLSIQNLWSGFLVLVALAFCLTLLLEFPFFWFALRSRERALRRALKATPVVHAISYTMLFAWYWLASGTSMLTQLEPVSVQEIPSMEGHSLYYLSTEGDRVFRIDLNDPDARQVIIPVVAPDQNDRLFVHSNGDAAFDLYLLLESQGARKSLLLGSFAGKVALEPRIAERGIEGARNTGGNFGTVPSLAAASDWKFQTGFWALEGISGWNTRNNQRMHYSLEMPFVSWPVRNATCLDGGFLIFQLGDDQICWMHPETRKVALLARGKGPVVSQANGSPTAPAGNGV